LRHFQGSFVSEPLWTPSKARVDNANLSRFMRFVQGNFDSMVDNYPALYDFSIRHNDKFWKALWEFCGIRASGELNAVVEHFDRMPGARWFPNVRLNFAQNLLRYNDDRIALIFRGEAGDTQQYSFAELRLQVARLAAAMRASKVVAGDRIAGFMPNLPQTIIAMLASTSIGAIWTSCSPDFGINGVLDRFGQVAPKILFSANAYAYGGKIFDCLDKLAHLLPSLPSIERVVVVGYVDRPMDLSALPNAVAWDAFLDPGTPPLKFEALAFDHPLYIMYSSGTTGVPKCIVHSAGGTLIQHLKELVLHTDVKREDRVFFYTTCGWMMWNWLVSTLATGATTVLYDGSPSYPDGNRLWDLADEFSISVFGTSAKWLSAIEKAGIKPRQTHKLLSLDTILSTGSPLAPESYDYVYQQIKPNVLLASISGGTDIISCFALGNPLLPVHRGELQCRGLGLKVEILDDQGKVLIEEKGELACTQPFPCMPIGFWNDPDGSKYHAAYFDKVPNVWCHGDHAMLTRHEGIIIYGRSDATLNPGGVRIGTAEIYRQVEKLEEVLESLAIGQDWDGDVRVVLFVRLRTGVELTDALRERIRRVIRDNTTPRHVPARIVSVADLPRTISGKITELAVRNIVHGRPVQNTDALANPQALKLFEDLPELQN
jgi:acetoacetyl-CoA synthetase